MPVPNTIPKSSPSGLLKSNPASLIASSAAKIDKWPDLSSFLAFCFPIYSFASKFLTSPANVTGKSEASNKVM